MATLELGIVEDVAAAPVEHLDFFRCECAPVFPDRFIILIRKGVFGIQLQLVDFEIGQVFGEVKQGFQPGNASA